MEEINVENGKVVLKKLKDFLHIEHVDYKVPQKEMAATINISAPKIPNYNFICWISATTQGFVRSCYIDTPNTSDAGIWFTQSTTDVNPDCRVTAYALYVKD